MAAKRKTIFEKYRFYAAAGLFLIALLAAGYGYTFVSGRVSLKKSAWKERHKQGLDCTVTIRKEKNVITMQTENLGIAVNTIIALTGDQCAITNIRVKRGE